MKYYIEWSIVSKVCHKEDLVKTTEEKTTFICRDTLNSYNFKDLNAYLTQKGFKKTKTKKFNLNIVMAQLAEKKSLDINQQSPEAIFKELDFESKNLLVLILILTNNHIVIKNLFENETININQKFNLAANKMIQQLIGYEKNERLFLISAAEAIALNKNSLELLTSGIIKDNTFVINSDIIRKSQTKKSSLALRKSEIPQAESKPSEETDKLKEYFIKYRFKMNDTRKFNVVGVIKYVLSGNRDKKFIFETGEDTIDLLKSLFEEKKEDHDLILFAVLLTNRLSEFKRVVYKAEASINVKIDLLKYSWLLELLGFEAQPTISKFCMKGIDAINLNGIDLKRD